MTCAARFETVADAAPDAPWLLLVHGVSQDRRLFDRQVEAYRAGYRILLVDLPGHGLSADLPGPYGLREYADALHGAMQAAEAAPAHFWGTHLGAGTGLLLACEAPGLFRSLVLESPVFPGRPIPSVSAVLERVARTARGQGMAAARALWWREGPWFDVIRARPDECRAAVQRALIDSFQGGPWLDAGLVARPLPPLDERLRALALPVLIVNGEHDVPDFLEHARALAALLPDCRRATVPEAGGFPLWEFPERANDVVRAFLASL